MGQWGQCCQARAFHLSLCGVTYTAGKGLRQVSIGELRMPLQLFTSLVNSSTSRGGVGGGFFKWESPNLVLSAADNALRSESSSPAPRTRESKSMVSSRPSLGAAITGGKPPSTHIDLGAPALGLEPGFRHSCSFGSSGGVGSSDTQSGSHSDDWADADQSISL